MRTSQKLKEILIQVKSNGYNLPDGIEIESVIDDMLRFIGDTDAELRDELIYSTFCEWADNGIIKASLMHKILNTCTSEQYLFLGIGEKDTDTVFTRSFSSLFIATALYVHIVIEPYLTNEGVQQVKQTLLRYTEQEKDFRGYVKGKGWAHAIAHVADALNNLVCCDGLSREDLLESLEIAKRIALNNALVYEAGEDDRIAAVFESVCERGILTNEDIGNWLRTFDYPYDRNAGAYPQVFFSHINRRHFLRCIYFMLLSLDGFEETAEYVKDILQRIADRS